MYKFNFVCETTELDACINHLADKMGFVQDKSGIEIKICKSENKGYTLSGANGSYEISYNLIPDFCRGLCVLIDKINKDEKDVSFSEERKIELCGLMADVSRNAVMRVEAAKDLISRIARMGMNTFMLYMEDVYELKDYPYFGYMRGAYTEEELKEIDDYANDFGVEVVACIQTLAHLKTTLRWQYAGDMKDSADILLVGEDKTYAFIDSMISTISRCLRSDRIHIGMDEADELGNGRYQKLHGYTNRFDIMCEHLDKVVDILKKYGKKPFMWSDMFFRIGSKIHDYYDPDVQFPEYVIDKIPKEVTMAYWDYYNEDADFYDAMIKAHKTMKCDIAFFGGVWTWNGVAANYDKTFRTTKPAIEACRKHGISEICATLWRDDGAETSIYTSLLGLQLYAEYVYNESVSMDHLKNMFRICTGYEMDSFLALDADNPPESENFRNTAIPWGSTVTMSKHLLYQDILHGLFDKQYENVDMKKHYGNLLENLSKVQIPEDLTELFAYHKQLIKVLYDKCDIGLKITENYKANNKDALKGNIEELKNLKSEISELIKLFGILWLKDNKAFGLDRIDMRLGAVKERINRAISRLSDYLSDKISTIEELEAERLPFAETDFVHNFFYNTFDSASI